MFCTQDNLEHRNCCMEGVVVLSLGMLASTYYKSTLVVFLYRALCVCEIVFVMVGKQ